MFAFIQGDSRSIPLRDNSIDCAVSSPPIWNLRDYGSSLQIGQESLVSEYLEGMRALYSEMFRVLKEDGLFGVNLGSGNIWTRREFLDTSMIEETAKHIGFLVVRLLDYFWLMYPGRSSDKRVEGQCLSFDQQAKSCIVAASAPGGFVLDPCAGTGVVARIAHEHGRNGIAIDVTREFFQPMEVAS
jgi:ubiquinone/menaquinone biosynthesis C-methylase UbiE